MSANLYLPGFEIRTTTQPLPEFHTCRLKIEIMQKRQIGNELSQNHQMIFLITVSLPHPPVNDQRIVNIDIRISHRFAMNLVHSQDKSEIAQTVDIVKNTLNTWTTRQ